MDVCVQCIGLQIYSYINRWKISFIKTQKHAFANLFCSHVTITNRFGKFAIWQTSFRKKLECQFKHTQIASLVSLLTTDEHEYVLQRMRNVTTLPGATDYWIGYIRCDPGDQSQYNPPRMSFTM